MRKKWIIVLLSLSILCAAVFVYFKVRGVKDFEPLIKEKLQQIVLEGSDSLYRLDIDKIEVDIGDAHITVKNLTLNIDSTRLEKLDTLKRAPDDVFKISLKDLVIDGIGPEDFLKKKSIDLNVLYIKQPVVEIYHHKRSYNYAPEDTITLYKKILHQVGHFSVNDLNVQNIDFTYFNTTHNNKATHLKNVSFRFRNILIDSTTQSDSSRFFYAKDAAMELSNYNMATTDSLYNFHVDSLTLNAASKKLDLTNISLKPIGKKENFSDKLDYYKERYVVTVKTVSIQYIEWWQLLSEDGLTARQIKLKDGNIEVFADRTLPDPHKNKVGNYPHQLVTRLKLPVMINNIDLNNFKVTYTELNAKTGKKGTVTFDDISGTFTNITNRKEVIDQNKYFSLNANAKFMNAGAIHALFKFDLANANTGNFSLDLEIGNMDGKELNTATKPLGLFEIKNADIKKILLHMNANDNKSNGTVTFFYNDLEVDVLKQDEEQQNKLKKRGLISFIANNFVIKQSNTPDDNNKDPKYVSYKRDTEKSFFNLIWKTIFTGLSKTVKGDN
jgi:hypothetical protein